MLTAILVAALIGIGLGIYFRVVALLVATAGMGIGVVAVGLMTGQSLVGALLSTLLPVVGLQAGYLAGLALSSRFGPRRRTSAPLPDRNQL
jgi:hypothetical protein